MGILMLIAVIPAFVLLFSLAFSEIQRQLKDAQREAFILAKFSAEHHSKTIEAAKQLLSTIVFDENIINLNSGQSHGKFIQLLKNFEMYDNLILTDNEGNLVASAKKLTPEVQGGLYRWAKKAASSDGYHFETVKFNFPQSSTPLLIAKSVKDSKGYTKGVIAVTLNLMWFSNISATSNIPANVDVTIINNLGVVMARYPDYVSWAGRSLSDYKIVKHAISGKEGTERQKGFDGEDKLFAYTYLSDDLPDIKLIVGIPENAALEHVDDIFLNITIWGGLSLLTLVAAWLGGNILVLRKIARLVQTTRKLSAGDLSARTEIDYNKGELGELARALDMMAGFIEMREMELDERTEDLQRSNNDLEQFAYVASHDLQEPLRMVASYTQLLKKRYSGRLDSDADEFIEYAVDGAARMQVLINDLLKFSRVGTKGKNFEPTDLNKVAELVLRDLHVRIAETGAKVIVDDLPRVLADDSQMHQVLLNLIGNAMKFVRDEKPVVKVSAYSDEKYWVICVEDNGIGIEEKYMERIFVIFQRLHTRTEYPGTGIGLALCKKIVERHRGKIWVESKPGEGSKFCFSIRR